MSNAKVEATFHGEEALMMTIEPVYGKFRLKKCGWRGTNPCNGWAKWRFRSRNSSGVVAEYYTCSQAHADMLALELHDVGMEIL